MPKCCARGEGRERRVFTSCWAIMTAYLGFATESRVRRGHNSRRVDCDGRDRQARDQREHGNEEERQAGHVWDAFRKTREKGGKERRRTSFAGGGVQRECRCEYSRYRGRNGTRSERLETKRRERRKADGRVAHAFQIATRSQLTYHASTRRTRAPVRPIHSFSSFG